MAKHFEERLQWRLGKEREKSGVATQSIREINSSGTTNSGRGYSEAPERNRRWEARSRGRASYYASEMPTEKRGVLNLVETEAPRKEEEDEGNVIIENASLAEQENG